MKTIYAIGDIHGMAGYHKLLLKLIAEDASKTEGKKVLLYLGDYIDRGPDSFSVVEEIMKGPPKGFDEQICLLGNHERLMLDYYAGRDWTFNWVLNGGNETKKSYQGKDAELKKHLEWMKKLQMYHIEGNYLFVHAGIVPGIDITKQKNKDLIWIREAFLKSDKDHGRVVVHGHSISNKPDVKKNRIGLDTGCWRSGVLTCGVFSTNEPRFITTSGY
jgi:serine/threonine protein phosphatase 1